MRFSARTGLIHSVSNNYSVALLAHCRKQSGWWGLINMYRAKIRNTHSLTHTYTHKAALLSHRMEALIASEQTPSVMGMLSGCYLVLCGNEIASNLYRSTLEGPWPLLEQGLVDCKGDFNQPAVWQRRGCGGGALPGNCKYSKWNE